MNPPPDTMEIRLPVRSMDELLDRCGSPLLTPRIYPEVARALRHAASGAPRRAEFRVTFEVPESDLARTGEVADTKRTHFAEEKADAIDELRSTTDKGLRGFLLAVLVVAVLILAAEAISQFAGRLIAGIISESLIILAWVTLWSPSETLLFGRIPPLRAKNLAKRLSSEPVHLVPCSSTASCHSEISVHPESTPC